MREGSGLMLEIPEQTLASRVEVDPGTTALVIVDMQNDFVDPRGKLYVASAQGTVPAIARLLDMARAASMPVVFTQDWHGDDDPEFALWGPHAVGGTWGAEIVPQLAPAPQDLRIRKLRYDAFFGTPLEDELRRRRIESLIVTGTVSNICVLHTAGSAALRWFRVIVPVDAISALAEFDQQVALRQIAFLYRGTLTRSDSIVMERRRRD